MGEVSLLPPAFCLLPSLINFPIQNKSGNFELVEESTERQFLPIGGWQILPIGNFFRSEHER
jgi:hypothetical protein